MCSGSVILAAAGLLEGRRATSHWLTIPALKAFGAIPVADERIVHQGNVVTSAGVSAGLDLALWLAGEIGGEGRAKAIQLAIEYDPQPPFDSGHMSKASATTKAAATALLSKDSVKPANMKAATMLAWEQALAAVAVAATAKRPGPSNRPPSQALGCRISSEANWPPACSQAPTTPGASRLGL